MGSIFYWDDSQNPGRRRLLPGRGDSDGHKKVNGKDKESDT